MPNARVTLSTVTSNKHEFTWTTKIHKVLFSHYYLYFKLLHYKNSPRLWRGWHGDRNGINHVKTAAPAISKHLGQAKVVKDIQLKQHSNNRNFQKNPFFSTNDLHVHPEITEFPSQYNSLYKMK